MNKPKNPTNRTEYLRVRLTRDERKAIEEAAEASGVRVSEHVRSVLRASLAPKRIGDVS